MFPFKQFLHEAVGKALSSRISATAPSVPGIICMHPNLTLSLENLPSKVHSEKKLLIILLQLIQKFPTEGGF